MILVTGAAGKTGRAILNVLTRRGVAVRALVRSEKQAEELKRFAGLEYTIGELQNRDTLRKAVQGVRKIYYICPNLAPDEVEIGTHLLELSRKSGVDHFVYHSVLHPQVEAMPHHWQKMRMEEAIFSSGVEFTILQPCAYMQNTLGYWQEILEKGIYAVPYATSTRLSIVDLEDIAEAAGIVLTQANHKGAIYELAGPEALSQEAIAAGLSKALEHPVKAIQLDRTEWEKKARKNGMNEYSLTTLLRMFEYYEMNGLIGNSNCLESLLGRPATTFESFLRKQMEFSQLANVQ